MTDIKEFKTGDYYFKKKENGMNNGQIYELFIVNDKLDLVDMGYFSKEPTIGSIHSTWQFKAKNRFTLDELNVIRKAIINLKAARHINFDEREYKAEKKSMEKK